MHEMAIAEGILDIALDYARRNESSRITKVNLLLGEMAGVEASSLQFCFASLVKGTLAEGAELTFTSVPLLARCASCGRESPVEKYNFICPDCGGVRSILSGRELRVDYLEME